MKKLVTISLIAFSAAIAVLLIANLLPKQKPGNNQAIGLRANSSAVPETAAKTSLDMAELAKHNSLTDCWLLIDGKFYDFTNFLSSHPGGVETMTTYCGRDGSQAFATKDKSEPKPHSPKANDMLANYYLGDLGQQFDPGKLPAKPQTTSAPVDTGDEMEAEIEEENEKD